MIQPTWFNPHDSATHHELRKSITRTGWYCQDSPNNMDDLFPFPFPLSLFPFPLSPFPQKPVVVLESNNSIITPAIAVKTVLDELDIRGLCTRSWQSISRQHAWPRLDFFKSFETWIQIHYSFNSGTLLITAVGSNKIWILPGWKNNGLYFWWLARAFIAEANSHRNCQEFAVDPASWRLPTNLS